MFKGNVLCSLFHGQRLAENRRLNPQKQVSGKDNDSSDDGLEEYDMDVAPSTSGRGSGRGKGKKRGSSTNQSSSTGRGSRGGRGRGRGRGSKSTSSASTNRQSTPNQLSFVSSTASSSSSVMREVVKSRTIKRSAINYEDPEEGDDVGASWTSMSRKRQKPSSTTSDNSALIDLTHDTIDTQEDDVESSNPFSAIVSRRKKK
jgi:hypothetical protein